MCNGGPNGKYRPQIYKTLWFTFMFTTYDKASGLP